jgi:Ni,Fe-hydrogenase maturation factor
VTGVIALDNTLVVTRHFGALPDDVVVIEVEPAAEEFGDVFSEPVARAVDEVCALVTAMIADADVAQRLPRAPLGGRATADTT